MNRRPLFAAIALGALAFGCGPGPTETSCIDGVDNDGNGLTDCADPVCAAHVSCGGDTDAGPRDGGPGGSCGSECAGCCDGDRCVSGQSLAACGQGGVACEACAIGASCEATGCEGGPVLCGPGNCDGCCDGDICVGGESDGACGSAGGACAVCESFQTCNTGACGVEPTTRWRISILDAVIPPTKFDGDDWDGIGAGECDPYVELRVGSAGAEAEMLPDIDNTLTPDWTEGGTETVLSPAHTAAELNAYLRFDMFDGDLNLDDPIGSCVYEDTAAAFDGEVVTLVCEPEAARSHAGFTLRWQLLPD